MNNYKLKQLTNCLSRRLANTLFPLFSCMKKLHDVVNIIPVIAKADTMTIEERDAFKVRYNL